MKVTNAKGDTFEVTFKKVFTTEYGLKFMLMPSDDTDVKVFKEEVPMFATMLELNHLNVGCAVFIIKENHQEWELPLAPTDNEFDLDAIYGMIERGECV
jgi:hypothetical protein